MPWTPAPAPVQDEQQGQPEPRQELPVDTIGSSSSVPLNPALYPTLYTPEARVPHDQQIHPVFTNLHLAHSGLITPHYTTSPDSEYEYYTPSPSPGPFDYLFSPPPSPALTPMDPREIEIQEKIAAENLYKSQKCGAENQQKAQVFKGLSSLLPKVEYNKIIDRPMIQELKTIAYLDKMTNVDKGEDKGKVLAEKTTTMKTRNGNNNLDWIYATDRFYKAKLTDNPILDKIVKDNFRSGQRERDILMDNLNFLKHTPQHVLTHNRVQKGDNSGPLHTWTMSFNSIRTAKEIDQTTIFTNKALNNASRNANKEDYQNFFMVGPKINNGNLLESRIQYLINPVLTSHVEHQLDERKTSLKAWKEPIPKNIDSEGFRLNVANNIAREEKKIAELEAELRLRNHLTNKPWDVQLDIFNKWGEAK